MHADRQFALIAIEQVFDERLAASVQFVRLGSRVWRADFRAK